MLGDEANPNLGAKAGETYDVIPFLVEQLRKHRQKLSEAGPHLLRAGEHLLTFYHLVETNHRRLSVETQQRLLDSMLQHNSEDQAAGGSQTRNTIRRSIFALGPNFSGTRNFIRLTLMSTRTGWLPGSVRSVIHSHLRRRISRRSSPEIAQ